MEKISVCITVKNEEHSIAALLDSLLVQTKKPDEIIIVDGGSTDNTLSVINNFPAFAKASASKANINFKFIKRKNLSIAQGRNLAIKNATGQIIVTTDAGCIAKRDWLAKIVKPFEDKNVDIVAGFYEMPSSGPLQADFNVFHGIPPEKFNKKAYIPSARSCAFRKATWKKLGGFNEKLKGAGEDTLFFANAVKNNFLIERVGDARVIWAEKSQNSIPNFFRKTYFYAAGDWGSGIWKHPTNFVSHNIKILLIFTRYAIGIALLTAWLISYNTSLLVLVLILFLIYLFYPVYKWYKVIKTLKGRLYLPLVQIISDIAVMAGTTQGIISKPPWKNIKRAL